MNNPVTYLLLLTLLFCNACSTQLNKPLRLDSTRDTLFVKSTQYPAIETDELILQNNGKSAAIYTMETSDGSSLNFLFSHGSPMHSYDCFAAYNAAADGDSFLFFNQANKRLYITYGIYAQFTPIPESIDFSKCSILLKKRNNTEHTPTDTLNVGRRAGYIESKADILSVEFKEINQ